MPAPEALSSAVAGAQEIRADVSWQVVDFISDLHLQAKDPATFAAWQHYMRQTPADALRTTRKRSSSPNASWCCRTRPVAWRFSSCMATAIFC